MPTDASNATRYRDEELQAAQVSESEWVVRLRQLGNIPQALGYLEDYVASLLEQGRTLSSRRVEMPEGGIRNLHIIEERMAQVNRFYNEVSAFSDVVLDTATSLKLAYRAAKAVLLDISRIRDLRSESMRDHFIERVLRPLYNRMRQVETLERRIDITLKALTRTGDALSRQITIAKERIGG